MTEDTPLVSVVVPTLNSEETLDMCLRSIRNQTHTNIEIIVVDSHSEDASIEIARKFDATVIQEPASRSEARNIGIQNATGEYLLSIDSDMELSPRVVSECIATIKCNRRTGGVVIPERSVGDSMWVDIRNFERQFYKGTVVQSARFFPMSLVRAVDGYDEEIEFFEESTLPRRIERKGFEVDKIAAVEISHHEEGLTLSRRLQKKYQYGKTANRYLRKFDNTALSQISPIQRTSLYLFRWHALSKRPILSVGLLLLKFLEATATLLGLITASVETRRKLDFGV